MRHRVYPRARADLVEIWKYTAAHWDVDQADRYITELEEAIQSVAANPSSGRSFDDVRAGYFLFFVGSHVLCYRVAPSRVEIVRVLHQRMDIARHL